MEKGTEKAEKNTEIKGGEKQVFDNSKYQEVIPTMDPRNLDFWEKMSAGAKGVMGKMYDGLNKIPVVNRFVAKVEIAHNQNKADKKETKQTRLVNKYNSLNSKGGFLEEAQRARENALKTLEAGGIISKDLTKDKHKLEKQKNKIEYKKDKLQSRVEKLENKKSLFINKRDASAERMIHFYEKKLEPIEASLERLETKRDKAELICLANEVKIDEQESRINDLEKKKNDWIEKCEAFGMTEKKARRYEILKEMDKQIEMAQSKIYIMRKENEIRMKEINLRLAKIHKKAEPYRNRKNQFIRIKDNRPVDFNMPERTELKEHTEKQEVKSYKRGEYVETEGEEKTKRDPREEMHDVIEQKEETDSFNAWITKLNDHLEKKQELKKYKDLLKIDQENIIQATRLHDNTKMTVDNFKKIITQYYKIKKIDKKLVSEVINNFK